VEVCPLCRERAIEYGWVREGAPALPSRPPDRRRRLLGRLFRGAPPAEAAEGGALRPLSQEEQALLRAAELFNRSSHRRTVEGLVRSLGPPQVSLVLLSGVNPEVVITICWEISWYQYRVSLDAPQPIQLAQRGYDPSEIPPAYTGWNAQVGEGGAIVATPGQG
jgi:hypothetical protein